MDAEILRRRTRFGASLALVTVAALLLAAVLLERAEPQRVFQPGSIRFDVPLANGKQVSLTEAMAALDVPLLRPSMLLASDELISEVWVRTEGPEEAVILYQSGITVEVDPTAEVQPVLEYGKARIENGSTGHLAKVLGIDAFVVPPDPKNGTLGSVRLAIGDSSVGVIGDGTFALESLIEVAESVVGQTASVMAQEASVA